MLLLKESKCWSVNDNDAKEGVAICQFNCIIRIKGNTTVTFSNNKAKGGGAVFMRDGKSSLTFCNSNAYFHGGMVYLGNHVALSFENSYVI